MAKSIRLRGHHLLCLLGFRGMGYSERFTANMRDIYETLRRNPDTIVTVVSGPDDLCAYFPEDRPCHCDNDTVHRRDEIVLRHLNIRTGERLSWREILQRIRAHVQPEHLPVWCAGCPWLGYGVCEEGVARIGKGQDLPPLSSGWIETRDTGG